jgi:predicted DNA-binding protein YlxM (UPF0122 family)
MLGGRGRPKIRNPVEIYRLYELGYSTVELAEKFHVTPQAIWQRLKTAGKKTRDRSLAQRIRRRKEKYGGVKGENS